MSNPLVPTMLWERADPYAVLAQRFRFATPEAAAAWLRTTVEHHYGLEVTSVDRLVMSSYNLLAWLTTAEGALLAKCCIFLPAHHRLLNAAELVVWLAQQSLPVSVPLPARTGTVQVLADHLSLGLQRIVAGDLLDPDDLGQARAAGLTLAHLHRALAAYPRAAAFAGQSPVPTLAESITTWGRQKFTTVTEPALVAVYTALQGQLGQLDSTQLVTQLVQRDYRAANILWHDEQIAALLDFEETCWGYRVNDLAWAAVHLGTRFHNWVPISAVARQTFLACYTAAHPLTAPEAAWLPLLLTWHSLTLAVGAVGGPTYAACLAAVSL